MAYLRILIGILIGCFIGMLLPQVIPSPINVGSNVSHPSVVMVFLLLGFGLGMAVGFAACHINKSKEATFKLLEKYANPWALSLFAVVTAFFKIHIEHTEFLPIAGFVILKYQLLLAFCAIIISGSS
ncbi:MAG: hypothetical protein PVI97_13540 [Candidatus Thiodiazotropha sp.]|jgi:hypothetical protein